jgi:hypothetical protein
MKTGLLELAPRWTLWSVSPRRPSFIAFQGGKLWYLDRMVLLFEEMKTRDTEYARREY